MTTGLLLESILSLEHVVDTSEVVGALADVLDGALRLEVLLQVGLFTELKSLLVVLRGDLLTVIQEALEASSLDDLRVITNNVDGEEGSGQTTAIREHRDSLAHQALGSESEGGDERQVQAGGVGVTDVGGSNNTGVELSLGILLHVAHEGLLDVTVGQALLIGEVSNTLGEIGGLEGANSVVVVSHTAVTLGDKLAGGHMEGTGTKLLSTLLSGARLGQVLAVSLVESLGIASKGVVAIDDRVLRGEVRLIEVVSVLHVGTVLGVEHKGSIRTNQHGDGTASTGRAGSTLGVDGNITGNNNSVTSIPGSGLNPVNSIEEGISTTVAGVVSVDTLDVGVIAHELHKHRLHTLTLVQKSLGTDLETTDILGVQVVLLKKLSENSEGDGVHILTVVNETHARLAKSNGELSGRNAAGSLELGLVNVLRGDIGLNSLDTNVFGGAHLDVERS